MTQNQFSAPGVSSRLFTYALERIGAAAAENPQKALVLGVAAGLVPMNYARAGMTVNAVDINPRMIAAAQAQLGLDPRAMNIIVADARTAARNCERDHDIAVIDLFRDDGMPEHLVTYEFFSDVHDCLRERGVMVMNAFMNVEHQESLNALLKTVAAAFGEVTVYTRTPEPGSTFTSAFILARRGGPAGTPAVALDGMPASMAQALREALDTGVALRPGDARFAAVPVLTDTANVWKHLALPVEIAYRRGVVGQMPWQVLLN
jgi:predicted membrane-bound spermidine synthase